ncbi:MAG: flagellar hook-length control protein FliK [Vicinamibacterales bacterium]
MITLGLPVAAEAIPAVVLTAEAGGAVGAEPTADFSNVLQQLMGPAPGARPNVNLPLGEDDDAGRRTDRDDVDELVNAIVVDLGAQPVLRLAATTVWAVNETAAMPATEAAAVDVANVPAFDAAIGTAGLAAAMDAAAITGVAMRPAAGVHVPEPETGASGTSFAALPAAAAEGPVPVPAAEVAAVAAAGVKASTNVEASADVTVAAPAAAQSPVPVTAPATTPTTTTPTTTTPTTTTPATATAMAAPAAARRDVKADGAAAPSLPAEAPAPPAATQDSPSEAVSTEPAREFAPTPSPASRATDRHDAARPVTRVAADAGQRAYAAAASEAPFRDTQQGFSDARPEPDPDLRSAGAPADIRAAAQPFHVIAERPVPVVASAPAAPVVAAPVVVDAAAAAELPAQVVQSIRMQAIDGGGEAIVRLRPDYLGELVVAVKVENGAVTAALQSDTPAVRKWVESNEATLRQALADHGLQLDRLTVSDEAPSADTGERESQEQREREDQQESQSRRQRKPAPDATFEVIV